MIARAAALLALGLAASPAFAEAVTYQGTIDDLPVFVEFSVPPKAGDAELFGRYFYIDKGIDIPLHAIPAPRNRLGLAEEVACKEDLNNCPQAQDDPPGKAPLGAEWELEVSDDGSEITGKWISGGRNHPVSLQWSGTREFDPAAGLSALTDFAAALFYSGDVLTLETSPYDYAKVALYAPDSSDATDINGNRYRYLTDVRTKFHFPRIVALADGSDYRPANNYLEQRHWTMSLDALWCVAQQFQGFGWTGYNSDAGTLGWWDEESVEVQYLTPHVMTWIESGSLSCGGAHPFNHSDYYNLDVKAGEPLDLSRIFKGWVAKDFDGNVVDLDTARANPTEYQWGPDEDLLAFVNAHRPSNQELGFTGGEDDCPIDELIASNLAISFKGDDVVHFGMDKLEYVVVACASDLYEAPIAELRDLLTPEAEDYFPSLAD